MDITLKSMSSSFKYRITGPHSVTRLEPLVHQCGDFQICTDPSDVDADHPMDFVWETYCEKVWKKAHDSATVLNRLHNTQIIEDKANLAFLQLRMDTPILDTFIAPSAQHALQWCTSRWGGRSPDDTGGSAASTTTATTTTTTTQFKLDTSLAKVSFLGEPHAWSVPYLDLSAEELADMDLADWWALKASRGNGGRDVWVVHRGNYEEVFRGVPLQDEYVLQRYVPQPLLWHNKKFHFRCYSLLRADMTAFLYEKAFLICAGLDYCDPDPDLVLAGDSRNTCSDNTASTESSGRRLCDMNRHLTNLSINKAMAGHPGLVPCLMTTECPSIFQKVSDMWQSVARAASPFMAEQRSPHHFEFFGIDVLVDSSGECWLVEVNRVPGLETSRNRCHQVEEEMFDEMMLATLQMVLAPLGCGRGEQLGGEHECSSSSTSSTSSNSSGHGTVFACTDPCEQEPVPAPPAESHSWWRQVGPPLTPAPAPLSPPLLFKNLFNWKAFTAKNKSRLVV